MAENLNLLPLNYNKPCIICNQQLTSNHIFNTCPLRQYSKTKPTDPHPTGERAYLNDFVLWKAYNIVLHDEELPQIQASNRTKQHTLQVYDYHLQIEIDHQKQRLSFEKSRAEYLHNHARVQQEIIKATEGQSNSEGSMK